MTTRSEAIAANIAARIIHNKTKKKWATLHADALEEIMSTPTSSNGLNASGSSPVRVQIGRDANVETLGVKPVAPNRDINPMAEQYQPTPISVKQVDHLALEGSNQGEHRAKPGDVAAASLSKAADNGGPRNPAGQFVSGKYEKNPGFISSPSDLADSDSGN